MSEERGLAWRLASHLKKYMLAYTVLSIVLAVVVGHFASYALARISKGTYTDLVMVLAIATVYPSMIQLRGEALGSAFKQWKGLLLSLAYVFLLAPFMAFALAPALGKRIGMGFMVVNVVPAGSASVGYVLIAGGSIELATALAIASLVLAIPAIPLYLGFYGSRSSVSVPISPIMSSILYILVLPLLVGQLTRVLLIRGKNRESVEKQVGPYLSTTTLLSLFALIFLLVMKEANFLIAKPYVVGAIVGFQALVIVATLTVSLVVSKALGFSYADHQAIAFTSTSKNQSVAAAIAMMALNPSAAIVPALIPVIQPTVAIAYMYFDDAIKGFLKGQKEQEQS